MASQAWSLRGCKRTRRVNIADIVATALADAGPLAGAVIPKKSRLRVALHSTTQGSRILIARGGREVRRMDEAEFGGSSRHRSKAFGAENMMQARRI
jgi:hypothetical protein